MPVINSDSAPTFDTGGAVITGLASPTRGARDTAAWRVRFRPGQPSPMHELEREEVFVVLRGALTAQFTDREETATAGGALIVPAGQQFALVARFEESEAVCMLPVGARAIAGGQAFIPPWAE